MTGRDAESGSGNPAYEMGAKPEKAPSPLHVELSADSPLWDRFAEAEAVVRKALEAAAEHEQPLPEGAEVSVLLTDDARIREMNRIWRNQDKPTNVLSFPAAAIDGLGRVPMLGDIAIAFETVEREAEEEGKPFAHHLSHLAVHGFLHLFGHDHLDDEQGDRMEALERSILETLSIPDPYADRA